MDTLQLPANARRGSLQVPRPTPLILEETEEEKSIKSKSGEKKKEIDDDRLKKLTTVSMVDFISLKQVVRTQDKDIKALEEKS